MANQFYSRRARQSTLQALSLALLLLYLAGSVHFELLHVGLHTHDEGILHSAEQEKDLCHRLMYHHDTEHGCNHESHWIAAKKCCLCDLAHPVDQSVLTGPTVCANINAIAQPFVLNKWNLNSYWAVISSSRAPPFLG